MSNPEIKMTEVKRTRTLFITMNKKEVQYRLNEIVTKFNTQNIWNFEDYKFVEGQITHAWKQKIIGNSFKVIAK